MELKTPFLRLPITFDADTLAAEAAALPASAWVPHPTGYAGNDAALLVTPGGRIEQGFAGPMAPTPHLAAAPYVRQVMASIGSVWGRSRLMRLAPGARVNPHVDTHYYWRTHWRIHVPVVTNPQVRFTCGGETVHMAPGECWLFDSFLPHEVHNGGSETRVHLVLDTVGGGALWPLIAAAQSARPPAPAFCAPDPAAPTEIAFERINVPVIMSPWEMRCHLAWLAEQTVPGPALPAIDARLDRLVDAWTAAWARYGEAPEGHAHFHALLAAARDELFALGAETLKLRNGVSFFAGLREIVFRMAVPRP
jgi:quercetin dioxygenase-like cupin family protein